MQKLRRLELERLSPLPDRRHDIVDHAARQSFVCPTCAARERSPCLWALPGEVPSWCSHPSRRDRVDERHIARVDSMPPLRLGKR